MRGIFHGTFPQVTYKTPIPQGTNDLGQPAAKTFAEMVENEVPGARVLLGRSRAAKMAASDLLIASQTRHEFTVIVPVHGSKILKELFQGRVAFTREAPVIDQSICPFESLRPHWFNSPDWHKDERICAIMEAEGRLQVQALKDRGWLAPSLSFHPYQYRAITWNLTRPGAMNVIRPGGGKTRVLFASALAYLNIHCRSRPMTPVLIWGPAITEDAWIRQTPLMSGKWIVEGKTKRFGVEREHILRTWVLKAESHRRVRDVSWQDYRNWCRDENIPPVVFVGDESGSSLFAELDALRLDPGLLLMDEGHCMAGNERWETIVSPSGETSFKPAMTKGTVKKEKKEAGKEEDEDAGPDNGAPAAAKPKKAQRAVVEPKEKRAATRSTISKQPSIMSRWTSDGTPMHLGKSKRLWAPLDLADPYGWGGYSNFRAKYTQPGPDAFSEYDDSEWNHMEELSWRMQWVLFQVDPEEIKRYMPPVRYEAVWLPIAKQDKVLVRYTKDTDAFDSDLDYQEAGGDSILERRVSVAALSKLSALTAQAAMDAKVQADYKCIIFVGRRSHAPMYAAKMEQALQAEWLGRGNGGKSARPLYEPPPVKWATGETTPTNRRALVDWFQATRSAILVVTYQAMGTSIDGLQCAQYVEVAALPTSPGAWEQLVGRAERLGGVGALIRAWFAERTYDERAYSVFSSRCKDVKQVMGVAAGELNVVSESLRNIEAWTAAIEDLASGIDLSAWGSDDDE